MKYEYDENCYPRIKPLPPKLIMLFAPMSWVRLFDDIKDAKEALETNDPQISQPRPARSDI